MTRLSRLPPRDLEALSAYADGRLAPAEREALERRLAAETDLRHGLEQIRTTRALLRSLPSVRPPRAFTLTPEMAGQRRRGLGYPTLQLATVLATVALIVTVGVDVFSPSAGSSAMRSAAPAQEMALEAPADALPPSDSAGNPPTEAGAAMEGAATPMLEAGALLDAVTPAALVPTATASQPPADSMSRALPTPGGASEVPPVLATAAPPAAENRVTTAPDCEPCGEAQLLPPEPPAEKMAVTPGTPPAAATLGQEAASVPESEAPAQAFALTAPPAPQAASQTPSVPLPLLRWLEVGLGSAVLLLAALTLWARRAAR